MSKRPSKGHYEVIHLYLLSHGNKRHDIDANFDILRYEESIFDLGVCSGHLSFKDVNDVINELPLIGGEQIHFKYRVSGGSTPISKTFVVYKITTESDSSLQDTHTLHFVSEEMVNNNNICIRRSYKDKSSVAIVNDLFSEINSTTKSKLTTVQTKGLHHIIIPGLTPLEAINFVASLTKHPSYKSGLFYFFENSNGFNFNCIENMIDSKPLGTFQKNFQQLDTGVREKTASLLSMTPYSTNPDTLTSMQNGMFANKFICYDPIAKKYKEVKYQYSNNFSDTKHLNKFKLDTDGNKYVSPDQKVSFFPSNSIRKKSSYYSSKTDSINHSNDFEDICCYNKSVFEQLFSKHFKITIKGDDVPSLQEEKPRVFTIGETIEINYNTKTIDKDKTNQPHGYIRGKYLVHWCEHIFRPTKYLINAKIASDTNSRDHKK